MIRSQRTTFFFAVEGDGEQSLITWIYHLSNIQGLHIHLESKVLGGGGYKTMLNRAVKALAQRTKTKSKVTSAILLVDTDRADKNDDGWSLEQLKKEAAKHGIIVCLQSPNLEGWYLRMLTRNEYRQLNRNDTYSILRNVWTDYEKQKPVDAKTLKSKFSLDHLLWLAEIDCELKNLLTVIGLYS